MNSSTPARPDGVAHHHRATPGWTTTWTDGPPDDWDEIRDRLRSLHTSKSATKPARKRERVAFAHTIVAQPAGPAAPSLPPSIEALAGPQPARVSWRPADAVVPPILLTVAAWLSAHVTAFPSTRWWRESDPLVAQRILLVVALLLTVLIVLQAL